MNESEGFVIGANIGVSKSVILPVDEYIGRLSASNQEELRKYLEDFKLTEPGSGHCKTNGLVKII